MSKAPRDPPITDPPIRLAVCVSGGGTTLQNLIDRVSDGRLRAEIVQVIASRAGIGAIARAELAGIPVDAVSRKGRSLAEFSATVFAPIRQRAADLVVFGGFLSLVEVPDDYNLRILNVHPALIPAFCGHGFYGEAVHRAVIEAGVRLSGCTVHFTDQTYDTGPIVLQRAVPVLDDDDPATLAARVFDAECEALPAAISLYASGRLAVEGRRVRILPGPP
jgi:phosphoribosylglycinamide formyltransferase-1